MPTNGARSWLWSLDDAPDGPYLGRTSLRQPKSCASKLRYRAVLPSQPARATSGDVVELGLPAPRHEDVCAFGNEQPRRRQADPAVCSGNDGDFSLQSGHCGTRLLLTSCLRYRRQRISSAGPITLRPHAEERGKAGRATVPAVVMSSMIVMRRGGYAATGLGCCLPSA